jgi:ATP-dependent helicase/nuclease subunit A
MTDSRHIDLESRRFIREDLLTNILVEAGAGSGKTQMLAERMAAGVAAGAYQIEHMAAVTFTRKAASELRGRFHLALEDKLCDLERAPSSEQRTAAAERLGSALGNLERFFAGTIHSFCARLLRERPVEAGVSPGFTELDEVQDLELRKRSWREFISSCRSAGDPDMLKLLETGVRPSDLDSAFAVICLNEDVEFPPGDAECPEHKTAWKALEKFWKQLEKHLPSAIDPDTTCKIQRAALEFRAQLRVARYRLDRPAVVTSLLETWDLESKIVQNRWGSTAAEKKRFKELITPLHEAFHTDVVEPYLSQWRQYVYRLSVSLLTRARDHAARERRRLNTLNYGDLLNLTARVLRENTEVRRALQQKYRFLFVDEFQDTDPVQAEIVFLLAANESDGNVGTAVPQALQASSSRAPRVDWRQLPVRAGALFIVGDPKQSIYRFRRADIEIYNIVRERFSDPAIGCVLPLTMNFRSLPELSKWANRVFETRFPDEPTPYSPRFAALDPKPEPDSGSGRAGTAGRVLTLTHTCGEQSDVPEQDASSIARHIRTEVDAGRRKYSDFLILTRKKADRIVPYATALEALNIPIEVSGAGAFGRSAEVATLRTLLRSLADPQDALSLVAVLRGPLFGISDPELFAYRQAGGWFSVFANGAAPQPPIPGVPVQRAASDERGPVAAALAMLHQYYRWTRVLPAASALDRILEHTGYLALASTTPGGVEAGDLLHAVDRIRQVVEEGGSLADAAAALDEDAEETNEVESLPLEPGRTDVVRVMNLHKAKGLEADVVFLADPCGGFNPRVDVHIARTGEKPQGWFRVMKKSDKPWMAPVLGEHKDWPAHESAERPFLEHEQDRLLYVAATRAREILVVSRWTGNVRAPAWGILNAFLTGASELQIPAHVAAPQPQIADCSPATQAEAHAVRVAAHDRLREPSWSITSVTAEARHIARMVRQSAPLPDDPTKVVVVDTPTHRADAGMAWGTLIHGLLEHAMRHPNATREDLRRLAMWLTVEEPQLRLVLSEALDTVQAVRQADFFRRAKSAERSVEVPFTFGDASALTTGVLDLIHRTAEGWSILDYKTDAALDVHVQAQYARQLMRYQEALQRCGLTVAATALQPIRRSEASEDA